MYFYKSEIPIHSSITWNKTKHVYIHQRYHVAHWLYFFFSPVFLWFQSAQNLAQISDLQAQLEEALKEKQDIQEKVDAGFVLLAYRWWDEGSQLKCAIRLKAQ